MVEGSRDNILETDNKELREFLFASEIFRKTLIS